MCIKKLCGYCSAGFVRSQLIWIYEALPGVLGKRGTRAFISGEQGNKGQILRGTGEQRQYWGIGSIRKQISNFGEQENKPIYFKKTREQVPPPPPPPGRASSTLFSKEGKDILFFMFQSTCFQSYCESDVSCIEPALSRG